MPEILLFSLAPFVGLLPLDRFLGKTAVITLSITISLISAVLIYPILFTDYSYTDNNLNTTVKTMAFASVGLLIGQVANLSDKRSFVILIGIVALLFSGLFITVKYINSVLDHKLDSINHWEIQNYKISCHRVIGYAGPAIIKYTLFQTKLNGRLTREVSSSVENNDTVCIILFEEIVSREKYYFDKCMVTIRK